MNRGRRSRVHWTLFLYWGCSPGAATGDFGGGALRAGGCGVATGVNVTCVECGYDLRGSSADGRCPECGTAVAESIAVGSTHDATAACREVIAINGTLLALCGVTALLAYLVPEYALGVIAVVFVVLLGPALLISLVLSVSALSSRSCRCTWGETRPGRRELALALFFLAGVVFAGGCWWIYLLVDAVRRA